MLSISVWALTGGSWRLPWPKWGSGSALWTRSLSCWYLFVILLIIDNSFVILLIIFFCHPADFTVHCLLLLQRLCIYMLSRLYHRRIHRRTQGRHFHLFFSANCCGLTFSNKAPFLCNISLDPKKSFVKSKKTAVGCLTKCKILVDFDHTKNSHFI